jgi:hypothetical protein
MMFGGAADHDNTPMTISHQHSWAESGGTEYTAIVCMTRDTFDSDGDGLPDLVDLAPTQAGSPEGLGHPAGSLAWDQTIVAKHDGPDGAEGLPACAA